MNKQKEDTGLRQCRDCNGIGTRDTEIRHMEHCSQQDTTRVGAEEWVYDISEIMRGVYNGDDVYQYEGLDKVIARVRSELARQRKETAQEIIYMITGLVEEEYPEAGAYANRLCGDVEKKFDL